MVSAQTYCGRWLWRRHAPKDDDIGGIRSPRYRWNLRSSLDHSTAEANVTLVKNGALARGDALVLFGEGHVPAAFTQRADFAIGQARAVADFGLEGEAP